MPTGLREAAAAVQAARDHIDAAAREDRRLAAEAAAAGKPLPKPLEVKARAKLEEAERMVGAAEAVATQTQASFLDALLEHREGFLAAADEALDAVNAAADAALDELEAALLHGGTLRSLRSALDDPAYLQGRSVMFGAREIQKLSDELGGPIEALKSEVGGN